MNNKKVVFIALAAFVLVAMIFVAVFLLNPPKDDMPEELGTYVPADKKDPVEVESDEGGLRAEQENSDDKYGTMREPE